MQRLTKVANKKEDCHFYNTASSLDFGGDLELSVQSKCGADGKTLASSQTPDRPQGEDESPSDYSAMSLHMYVGATLLSDQL